MQLYVIDIGFNKDINIINNVIEDRSKLLIDSNC